MIKKLYHIGYNVISYINTNFYYIYFIKIFIIFKLDEFFFKKILFKYFYNYCMYMYIILIFILILKKLMKYFLYLLQNIYIIYNYFRKILYLIKLKLIYFRLLLDYFINN